MKKFIEDKCLVQTQSKYREKKLPIGAKCPLPSGTVKNLVIQALIDHLPSNVLDENGIIQPHLRRNFLTEIDVKFWLALSMQTLANSTKRTKINFPDEGVNIPAGISSDIIPGTSLEQGMLFV